jgi:hypothetical protein
VRIFEDYIKQLTIVASIEKAIAREYAGLVFVRASQDEKDCKELNRDISDYLTAEEQDWFCRFGRIHNLAEAEVRERGYTLNWEVTNEINTNTTTGETITQVEGSREATEVS